jgi:beta-N-acetylhexosaminidase
VANQSPESALVAKLSPRQLAGQRVIYGYSGRTPPASLLSLIRQGDVGGVIFFGANYANRSQFTAAVKKLEAANRASTNPARGYPLLLMTDQEGGLVRRLPGAPYHSEKWIGSRGTPAGRANQARTAGSGAAANLLSYGLNVNLAPVLDVYRAPGDFDDQFQRSYSTNPKVVAALGADFISAQQHGGVAATAKHFPGLGAATASQNTDQRPVTIRLSKATLQSKDEYPYHAAVGAGVDLVMVSWAKYPHLGSSLPAGLSSAIVKGQLRKLGFHGLTITDAIGAGALAPYGSTQARALMAAEAGMQLILASDSVSQGTQCLTALRAGYGDGKLNRADFRATVNQILALRASLQP